MGGVRTLQLEPRPLARRATLTQVAALAGVSPAVASRALSGTGRVAHSTRVRVRKVAHSLGYRPSSVARTLSARESVPLRCAVVGLGLSADALGNSFYGKILSGLAVSATAEGLDVHLVAIPAGPGNGVPRERARALEALRQLAAEDRADGFVVFTSLPLEPHHLHPLRAAGVPLVLVNRHLDDAPGAPSVRDENAAADLGGVHCVTLDRAAAAVDAVARLAALGHRRVAVLLPDADTSPVRDQLRGWREGLARAGLLEADGLVLRYPGAREAEAGARFARVLFGTRREQEAGTPRPTAVVCFNDICAHGVLDAALAARVSVPDRLSVVGFDNQLAPYMRPALCSYGCDLTRVGEAAAQLMGRVLRREPDVPAHVRVSLEYFCRESCAGP